MFYKRINIKYVLLILTLGFIWGQSILPKAISSAESNHVLSLMEPLFYLIFSSGVITEHLIRKIAHFCEFAFLGFQLYCLPSFDKRSFRNSACLAFFSAFLDESIQMLSDRGDQISDVWLDFSGALFGIVFAMLILFLIAWHRSKQK